MRKRERPEWAKQCREKRHRRTPGWKRAQDERVIARRLRISDTWVSSYTVGKQGDPQRSGAHELNWWRNRSPHRLRKYNFTCDCVHCRRNKYERERFDPLAIDPGWGDLDAAWRDRGDAPAIVDGAAIGWDTRALTGGEGRDQARSGAPSGHEGHQEKLDHAHGLRLRVRRLWNRILGAGTAEPLRQLPRGD